MLFNRVDLQKIIWWSSKVLSIQSVYYELNQSPPYSFLEDLFIVFGHRPSVMMGRIYQILVIFSVCYQDLVGCAPDSKGVFTTVLTAIYYNCFKCLIWSIGRSPRLSDMTCLVPTDTCLNWNHTRQKWLLIFIFFL